MDKGEKKAIVWLLEDELKAISEKQFTSDRLTKVRDVFLFQCYSGISFSDMRALVPEDYQYNEEYKQLYVEKRRIKTNELFTSVILKEGKAILEKYSYKLPCLTNQKYNEYLKEIQALCGITKSLHTHLGRTTYVCLLYNKGMSPEIIAKLVGHSTAKTTLRYYAEMDKSTIMKAVQEIENRTDINDENSAQEISTDESIRTLSALLVEYSRINNYNPNSPLPKDSELMIIEDNIINCLISLKNNNQTFSHYKVSFAKCVNYSISKKSFIRRQIANETNKLNVKKLKFLLKAMIRFESLLKGLDKIAFNSLLKR